MRWGMRLIGLVSTVILARLLTPEDFGLVAMASLVIGLLQSFSQMGVQMLIIREPELTDAKCNTAWTIQFLQGVVIASCLFLVAPYAALYFKEPRVVEVIYWLALGAIIMGLANIGMVLVRKELDFARDFRFNIYVRLMTAIATVALALALRSYWALVWGQIIAAILRVLLSFGMHHYRPRFSLVYFRQFLRFAAAILPFNIGYYLNNMADVMVVGGIGTTAQMGSYSVSSDVSSMATREVVDAMGRGLYPNLAKLTDDPEKLATAFLHVLNAVTVMCLAFGLGLYAVAEDFVMVVLGSQWSSVVPLVKWLALYMALGSLVNVLTSHILVVTGHERASAVLIWVRIAILVPMVVFAGTRWGIEAIAAAAASSSLVMLIISIRYATRVLPISVAQVIGSLWRPAVASGAMVIGIHLLHMEQLGLPFVTLALDVTAGAVIYGSCLIVLWRASGKPPGLEKGIMDSITRLAGRLRSATRSSAP